MSDALVPLDPNCPQAKEAIINLLGTTLAELKNIDKSVVGSSKFVSGNRTNLENVFRSTVEAAVQPAQVPATVSAPANSQVTVTFTPPPQQQQSTETASDPNQLVFDFNQKITPDIVNGKLDRILDKLDRIIEKLSKT